MLNRILEWLPTRKGAADDLRLPPDAVVKNRAA
jgi:hypothetical protein